MWILKNLLKSGVALVYTSALLIAAAEHGEVSELAEGARLEIVYAPKAYPGFESLPLRHLPYYIYPLRKEHV